jgi:hypothetical protein
VAKQQQCRLGRPLEVVEHEEDRLLGRGRDEPGGDSVEQAVALSLGIGPEWGRQARCPLGQLGYHPDKLPAVATQAAGQHRSMVHEVAQGLHEGLVRDTQVLVAAPGQHRGPFVVNPPGELGGQPGLAHPRFTRQEGDTQLAGRRLLPQLPEPFEVAVPADEDAPDVSEERWERDRGLRERFPVDLNGRDRLGQTLQLEAADGAERPPA